MKYIISMMDGTKTTVPQQVGEAVLEAKSPFVKFGNRMFNLKSISKIEPSNEADLSTPQLSKPKIYTKRSRIRALESLLRGLNKSLIGATKPEVINSIIERADKKLKEAKLLREGEIKRRL